MKRQELANRIEKAKKQLKPLIDPMVAEYNSVNEELVKDAAQEC